MPPQAPTNDTQPQAANDNRVSPAAWGIFFVSLIIDGVKVFLLFLNAIPAVGTEIDAVLSFYLSVVELVVVFGGLWLVGVYKSSKNLFFNLMSTFGVTVVDLVPIVDDLPITAPVVFWMIVKAYAQRSRLGGLFTTAAIGAATGGAGIAAEGAMAGNAAAAGGAARAGTAARAARGTQQLSSRARGPAQSPAGHSPQSGHVASGVGSPRAGTARQPVRKSDSASDRFQVPDQTPNAANEQDGSDQYREAA